MFISTGINTNIHTWKVEVCQRNLFHKLQLLNTPRNLKNQSVQLQVIIFCHLLLNNYSHKFAYQNSLEVPGSYLAYKQNS